MESASIQSLSSQNDFDDPNKENNPDPRLLWSLPTAKSEERRIKLQQFRNKASEVEGIAQGISDFNTNPEVKRQILENITNYERDVFSKAQEQAKDTSKDANASTQNSKPLQISKKEDVQPKAKQPIKVRTKQKAFKTPEEELKESIEYLQKLCNFQEALCIFKATFSVFLHCNSSEHKRRNSVLRRSNSSKNSGM